MKRPHFWLLIFFAFVSVVQAQEFAVVVYGATPAGIAAAVAAAGDGEKVLLVEPSSRVGGMITNGLSHTDFRTLEGLSGAYLDFSRRVESYYRSEFGEKASALCFGGTHAEPKVNLAVFEKMLTEQPLITLRRGWVLEGVRCSSDGGEGATRIRTVEIALFADEAGEKHPVPARFFIDATYEGDLMAAAGVSYQVGREGQRAFNEPLAPERGDTQLQGYNFRLVMTRDPANRLPVQAPDGYQRNLFTGVLPLLESGEITSVFGQNAAQIYKAQTPPLPNEKFDINDMSQGLVRLSLPGTNDAWPDGAGGVAIRAGATDAISAPPFSRTGLAISRERIFRGHMLWSVGLLYFLQNEPAVPAKIRDEAREWGWCKDEFTETGGIPEQIYVREARRMIGEYTYTEHDTDFAPNDARAVLRKDAIAMGDYGPNCRGTEHEGELFGGRHTGEFYKLVAPYQIPYGVLVPRDIDNLLVPGAMSATHVGFCTLRYEPIRMSLGQAAGHAVHLARMGKTTVQRVPIVKLQARLHDTGAATIYISDVPPAHRDFAAVQWWASAGGFHGLAPTPAPEQIRGKNITGQYFEAFPNHAAELVKPLDPVLIKRWIKLAQELGLDVTRLPKADGQQTRGEWIRTARQLAEPPPVAVN